MLHWHSSVTECVNPAYKPMVAAGCAIPFLQNEHLFQCVFADAGSDSEEAISDSEEGDVYDTSTDYDSEDEATPNNTNTRHQQSSATTAQQQVTLTNPQRPWCCLSIKHRYLMLVLFTVCAEHH